MYQIDLNLKVVGSAAYHDNMNHVHDSTREKQERTTQYISHGVS